MPHISLRTYSKYIYIFSLWPYAGGGHYTSAVKGLSWWSLPPKCREKTLIRYLIIRSYSREHTVKGSTRYSDYLEGYWPCASGLSTVNAIGTQLRDPINSGLTRCCVVVKIYGRRSGHREESRE